MARVANQKGVPGECPEPLFLAQAFDIASGYLRDFPMLGRKRLHYA
jgi:hypothetical protein